MIDHRLVRHVVVVSGLGALALLALRAHGLWSTIAGVVLLGAALAGLTGLVRLVVLSERAGERR